MGERDELDGSEAEMIFEKRINDLKVTVSDPSPRWAEISANSQNIQGLSMEDLRDLRHMIDAALRATKA